MRVKRHTLINALRAAADIYLSDASLTAGQPDVARGFRDQASEVMRLAEEIEGATTIHLED